MGTHLDLQIPFFKKYVTAYRMWTVRPIFDTIIIIIIVGVVYL